MTDHRSIYLMVSISIIAAASWTFGQYNTTPQYSDMTILEHDLISGATSETKSPAGQPLGTGETEDGADEWGGWWCKLSWQFLRSSPSGDVYRFTEVFWWKGGNLDTQTKDITYSGLPVVIFENKALRTELKPGFFNSPPLATPAPLFGLSTASWIIFWAIAILISYRLSQFYFRKRPIPETDTAAVRLFPTLDASVLEYASGETQVRRPWMISDLLYFCLCVTCYVLAGYAQQIMPGGANWSGEWEYASFLMTIAALSSLALFLCGLYGIFIVGRKRVAILVLIGVWLTGFLPVLMFFFSKRWLQGNFA